MNKEEKRMTKDDKEERICESENGRIYWLLLFLQICPTI